MVLPPILFGSFEGLGVYPKPPVVEDATQRGDFTGQRIDTVTYLCEIVGTYRLPALSIPWFDVDDNKLKHVELPAVTLEIAENPKLASTRRGPSASTAADNACLVVDRWPGDRHPIGVWWYVSAFIVRLPRASACGKAVVQRVKRPTLHD